MTVELILNFVAWVAVWAIFLAVVFIFIVGAVTIYRVITGTLPDPPRRYRRPINSVRRARKQAQRDIYELDEEADDAMDAMDEVARRHLRNKRRNV